MRDILIIVLIAFSILITSVFCVEKNMVVMKTNIITNNTSIYTQGIHFKLPFIYNLTHISLNKRFDSIAISYNHESTIIKHQDYMVIWHVVSPLNYYNNLIQDKQQLLHDVLLSNDKNQILSKNGIYIDKIILVNQLVN